MKTMRTFLHAIIIAATLAVAAPTQSIASTSIAEMTMSSDECKARIVVNQSTVTIEGLAGKTLEVVSLTGRIVMKTKIESNSQQVELNVPKGCYILKIDNIVRKVSIS